MNKGFYVCYTVVARFCSFCYTLPCIFIFSDYSRKKATNIYLNPNPNYIYIYTSFRHASPHLWNQLPTSLRIPHPCYSSAPQWPSFEHAGLTCCTLLSPSITLPLFHSELKTYLFILSSTLVSFSLSDWSHGSRLFTGLLCSSVLCFSSIFFCSSYS